MRMNKDITFSGQFWYGNTVAFSSQYDEVLNELTTGTSEDATGETGSGWKVDQPHREGIAGANQQRGAEAAAAERRQVLNLYAGQSFYQLNENDYQGAYNPETMTMSFLKKADFTTIIHETGHFFLDMYVRYAGESQQIARDLDGLLKWFRIEGTSPEERFKITIYETSRFV